MSGGKMVLYVDGRRVGESDAGLLTRAPAEGLSIGAEEGSAVGSYEGANPFAGEIEEVQLYWGRLGETEIRRWAGESR